MVLGIGLVIAVLSWQLYTPLGEDALAYALTFVPRWRGSADPRAIRRHVGGDCIVHLHSVPGGRPHSPVGRSPL